MTIAHEEALARPIRVVVAGSRDFEDEALLFATLDKAFGRVLDRVTVISGHARGADQLGEKWAKARGVGLIVMPVTSEDWEKYGKGAGHRRNRQMGDIGTHASLFWDGKSPGTRGMRDYALEKGLWVKTTIYKKAA